ncbi:MAG: hypothetical protein MI742_09475 [Desulfobacterales bacterium]|nr:hypothetical protein [Desulfobacterales bacterium]
MHEIRVDVAKNRLYFTLGAISCADELAEIVHKIQKAVLSLPRGFTCITDLRHFSLSSGLSDNFMRLCQEALWDSAIAKVVRVKKPGCTKKYFSYEKQSLVCPGYSVDSVFSIEEAETLLDHAI